KPAPLQVCWLAYPGTTGLSAMDHRVTDRYLDPEGVDLSLYSEQSLFLPDSYWCYAPRATTPEVGPLPAGERGPVTFGCQNNYIKLNPELFHLWARVLGAVPGSRLLVLVPPGDPRRAALRTFEERGVDPARIRFVEHREREEYLATYQEVDICLDTLPYNGHTTSLDALWMGVPVVTLRGDTIVGRAGVDFAMNLGLPELIADTPDDYVRIAKELADDRPGLAALRAGLRRRLEGSPLMDGPRFTRNLEALYRRIWRRWCGEGALA
ncbi:MAG: hypothetical protein JOZ69_15295, partial [Myxococcales bacterium]|nr:hypothetical protein [Myxococcales bacterium]